MLIVPEIAAEVACGCGKRMKRHLLKSVRRRFEVLRGSSVISVAREDARQQDATHRLTPRRPDPFEPLRVVFDLCTKHVVSGLLQPTGERTSPSQEQGSDH